MKAVFKTLIFVIGTFFCSQAFSISLSLDGTRTVESGTDCDIATYRFGLNESWNGTPLDLLVEVVAEDNEYDPATLPCVGIEGGVFSVSLRDTDPGEDVAFIDTVFTVVQAGTTTPVYVDRITATGFDLDMGNGTGTVSTDTDDVYLSGAGATYLAGSTLVAYSQGSFPGGYDVHLEGQTAGNCDDTPTTPVVSCRGSASWIGSGAPNLIATFNARFQNDNAYGQYTGTFNARRLLQLSLEDEHAEELFTAISDHGDTPSSYGDADHQQVSMFTILGYGLTADHDDSQQPGVGANGDDTDMAAGTPNYDDEDAIFRNGVSLEGQTLTAGVNEVIDVVTFGSGYLSGWVDLNHDGDFLDAGEKVLNDVVISSTTVQTTTVSMNIPLTALGGIAYARFRFDTQAGIAHNGTGLRGEVEDYQVYIDPMKPEFNMVKSSDTAVMNAAGQITYTFAFENTGNVPLSSVSITDPNIDSGSLSGCPIATLPVGATATCTATRTVTQAQIDSGTALSNTASAGAFDPIGGPVTESDLTDNTTQTVITPTFSHSIVKATPVNADNDGSGDVSLGDVLTYTVTATNTGTATLTNLFVEDLMLNPSSQNCGAVAPAGTCVLTETYTVTSADVTAGSIDNTATARSDQTAVLDDTQTVPLLQPALDIDKPAPVNADEDGSTDVSVGDTLTYTITATNSGASTLTTVVVWDNLLTPSNTACATLAPGATCVLVGDYVVTAADVAAGQIDNTASADSDQTPSVDDSETVPVPAPALTVDKPAPVNADEDGSTDISVGDTLTYTVTATNSGASTLTTVVVWDNLLTPSNTTCPTVAPGGTCVLTGTYVVTAADVAAGQINNTGQANSDQTPPVDDVQVVNLDTPSHILDKAAPVNADEDGSTDISLGDTLTYTVTATNNGTATLTNLVVSDPMLTPNSTSCATVAASATCVLTGIYTVTAADVAAGSIVNTASSQTDQTPTVDDTETVPVPAPALALDKAVPVNADEDGSTDISIGDTLSYTITASNTGTAVLTNVVVSDPLITPNTITCGSVAAGADCVLTGTYVVTAADVAAGQIDNTASADSDQTNPVDDSQLVIVNTPSHVLDKSAPANADEDGSTDISVGDTLTYTVTATNNGSAVLTNLLVSDPMLTPNSTTCASVAPSATCVLTGTYTVTAVDVAAGSIVNTASSQSDQTGPVDDTETVVTPVPALSINKPAPVNADEDGSTDVSVGDTLTYTVTATNSGTSTLTTVVVWDSLLTPTNVTCPVVAPGGTCVLTGTYVVTAADVAAGQINNTGQANSDQTPPVDDVQVVNLDAPSHVLDKAAPINADEDGSTDISVGDTLTYTVTATNNGAAVLTNLVVSDPMLTPSTTACATVAPVATCVLTGTYSVTAADVAAGSIVNTASSQSDQTGPIDDTETVVVPTPALSLNKPAPTNADEDGSTDVSVGDTLTYTVTATNSGTSTLTTVVVWDNLLTPSNITCPSVAPGGTCVLTGAYVVTAADVAAGQVNNTGQANSDQTPPVDDVQVVNLDAPSHVLDKAAPVNADEDGSTDISVGDTLTYTITATNNGAATLTNLVVIDPMLTPNNTICASVAPTATCVLTGTYSVTAADVAAGSIVNTASSHSDQTDPVDDTETVPLPVPALALDKSVPVNADEDGSADISAGDTLTYTITATNNGTATLTNLVVTDPLVTPTTTMCASVAPGATCVLIGTYTVVAADVAAGSIDNTATADSDQTPPVDDVQSVMLNAPSHVLDKAAPVNADEDGSTDLSVGDTLTYTVTATNNGAAMLTNLVVSDPMLTPNTNTCASVAPSATCVLIGTYSVTAADVAAGSIVNTASSQSDQTGPVDDTETVVTPTPALSIVKPPPANADEDGSTDVSLGDTLTYTVTATNSGTATLTTVVVWDNLLTPSNVTCPTIAPGGTCVLTGTYVVTAADVAAGQINNTGQANSDQTPPVDDVQVVNLDAPSHVLDKAAPVNADEDGSTDISAGDTLTYTVTATNNGAAMLTNLVVSDPMLTPNTNTCATVAPAATCVLTGTYIVTAADVTAGSIVNTASSVSDQTGPVDDTETVVVPTPALVLDKPFPVNADEDGSTDISLGDTLTYTITATNSGTSTLTTVVVWDNLITPSNASCASVAPGATCVLVGDYVVTAADVAAGQIDNIANADSDQTPPVDDSQLVNLDAPSHVLDKAVPVNADEDGSTDISAGDTLTYTVTATNNGAAMLTNLVVSDPMLTPNTNTCATVAPAATCVLTGTHIVTAADVTAGSIVNTASSVSDQTGPVDDTETVIVPTPALVLDKPVPANADEDGSTDISLGDTLTYTVTATNSGTSTLTSVVIWDPMITPNNQSCATLAPSATCVLVGTYVVTAADVAAGQIDNIASTDSDQTPPVEDNQSVVLGAPSHVLDKAAPVNADEDGSTDLSVGDTLSYTVTATNNGAATLTNLVVSDPMLTPNAATCATVAPTATCVLTGTYAVTAADVAAGTIVNTASSVSDQTGPVDDTETVVVPTPALVLDKPFPVNADEDSSTDISLGDTLTYTITATNSGTSALTTVVVWDNLITPNNTSCALVAPGATCVLVGDYVVTAADVAAGQIDNIANADSDQTPPVDDSQLVNLDAPSHVLDKATPVNTDEDGSTDVSVGDTLTYTVTATNNGAATLTNLAVSDPMLTPNTQTCATVAPSATCVLTGSYTVTASDVTAGSIVNTASSVSDQTGPVDDTETVVVPTPELVLDKPMPVNADEDGSTDISLGDTLTYTITATNSGTSTLTTVVVWDDLITPSNTSCASLAPGATCVLVGDYVVTAADVAAGQIDNTANTDSDQTPPVDDSQLVNLDDPSHVLDKAVPVNADEDGSTDISVGDTLTYTITATNNGAATLTNLVVSDPMITPNTMTCASVAPAATCALTGIYTVTAADVAAGSIVNTASSQSDQTGPIDDTETVVLTTPALALDKSVPVNADEDGSTDISLGDTLTYTVTATNSGTSTLTNVVVWDNLITPNNISCASVAPGATCVLIGDYVVTAADVAAGQIDNTASADSDQTPPVDDSQLVNLDDPSHVLDKAAPVNADEDGSTDLSVGDTLTYTITATNNGAATLTNLTVSDPMLTPNTQTCASVSPSATCVLTGTYTVTVADVAAGSIVNTASSVSDQTGPVDDTETVVVPAPALALDKSVPVNADEDGSTDISIGDTLTYTITATNSGTSTLTTVVVWDGLITPSNTTCASVAPAGTCVLLGTYVVTAADVAAARIDNTASAESDQTPPVDDVQNLVLNAPSLALDKAAPVNVDEDGSGDISVGDTLAYTITATNNGSSTLTNVVVSDPLITPANITCNSVAPGASCILVGNYSVTAADVAAGSIDNTATADSDQTGSLTDAETVPVAAPGHVLSKAAPSNADEDGSGDISAGDTLTYTITATNNSAATLTNMVVSDAMITPNTTACATVLPGGTCVLTGSYVVTPADVSAGQINNTATSASDQTGPIDDTHTVVLDAPGLSLVKAAPSNADEDNSGDVSVADTLSYTITATNTGTSTLTNVVVTDPLITPASASCVSLAPAATCVLNGNYAVTAADVAAGQIVNTAAADSDQTDPVSDTYDLPLGAPSLTLVKSAPVNADEDGSNEVSINDTLSYTITATNNGGSTLTNVVVSDPMLSPNNMQCASVVTGGTCVLTGTYVVTAADVLSGGLTNVATADSDQTPPVDDEHTLSINVPVLTLVKGAPLNADEDASGELSLGDTLTYTITATNSGLASLTNLVVSDSMISPSTTTCAIAAPGADCVLTGSYVIAATDVGGQIVNTATADSDQTGAVTDSHTVPVPAPAMTLVKSLSSNADEDGSGDISLGDTLTYSALATNTGVATLSNVFVADSMLNPASITCATLAPGAACELIGTHTVTEADVAAGSIVNTATVDSDQLDPIANSLTLTVPQPELQIVKSDPVNNDADNNSVISVGDLLTYTVTATNSGTAILTNVVVSDPMLTPASVTCATVVQAATCILTGSYTVAANDAAIGGIVNTATADSTQTGPIADSNTVIVVPLLPPVTQDDSRTDLALGQPVTVDVLGDDSDPDNNIDPTTVVIIDPATGTPVTTLLVPGEGGWQVDPATGAITFIPQSGFMGDPTPIQYMVSDVTGLPSNPSTVTLDYEAPASLSGTVWMDVDRDGQIDAGEPIKPGWTLEIYDDGGNLVATTMTDAKGEYQVEGLIPGEFTVKFFNEDGVYIAESSTNGAIAAGQNVDLPLPVDPSGVVYDSVTREPVFGVTLQLVNSLGIPVNDACVNSNQQGQTTQADGFYAFDVFPDAHPSCADGETYSIEIVSTPVTYTGVVSENIPPDTAVFDSAADETNCTVDAYPQTNACEVLPSIGAPQDGEPTRYFMAFQLSSGDSNVILNHIPIDPVIAIADANMRLQKSVSRTSASTGDVLYYTVTVENDLAEIASGVSVTDDLPAGFRFVEGSATVTTFDATNQAIASADVVTTGVDPVIFGGLSVPALDNGVIAINYAVRVGAGVVAGNHINTAQVTGGGASNIGTAAVMLVPDPVLNQATLLGKVFHDRDTDGYQEDAHATGIKVKSDYFGWSSLNVGDIAGRRSEKDPLSDHQVVVNMPLSSSNRFEVTTAEGTYLFVDENQTVTESHAGQRAHGLTGQDLQITTRITEAVPTPGSTVQINAPTKVLEITITNVGINEEGLPGVRLATVDGLVIESDQAGRFHIPDAESGSFSDGQQFILKIDPATLPVGSTLTTENPRVMRITGNAPNIMNFGVVLPQTDESAMAVKSAAPAQAVQARLGTVFFDTDKHNIRFDQRGVVQDIIARLRQYGRGRVIIEAHADKRQTSEYNIALTQRRARTVENELRRVLGDELMKNVTVEVDTKAYREADNINRVEALPEIKQ